MPAVLHCAWPRIGSFEPVDLDREVCICFHVSTRKVVHFIRLEKPQRASQLSACFGAGTGCGWCRPFLEQLFVAGSEAGSEAILPEPDEYARLRTGHVRFGKGVPPPRCHTGLMRGRWRKH
ncbi:MAG: bacterioferritin-associated ferredoxin [Pirellulaceae bacterium]